VRGIYDEQTVPKALRGDINSKAERALHQFIRLEPETYTVPWLSAADQEQGLKTTDEKIKDAVPANKKHFHTVEGPHAVYSNALQKQVAAKIIYEDRVTALEREQAAANGFIPKQREDGSWDVQYHADAYDQAVVAYDVMKRKFPEVIAETKLPPPNDFL